MPKRTPDSWIVEEVMKLERDGRHAVVRISQTSSYEPEQKWPKRGQVLVVKDPK